MRLTSTPSPNIALLLDYLGNAYQRDLIDGVMRAAAERGATVWIFVGGWFKDETLRRDENVVYQLVKKPAIDGVVAAMSSLITLVGRVPGERALRNLRMPAVSIGLNVAGVPSMGVDNRSGLKQLCEHLVHDHGYRRFAMIAGPAQNEESQLRIAACHDTLESLGVSLPEQRVTRQGFVQQSGVDGVRDLLEKRGATIETLDAIICASDLIAEGALKALTERGASVPERIALTGFDDLERSRYLNPPLTTVRQPVSDLARRATLMLIQSLGGKPPPLAETVPSSLVLRRSCGCLPSETRASIPPKDDRDPPRQARAIAHIMQRREAIYSALSTAAGGRLKGLGLGWERRWLSSIKTDLETPRSKTFLSGLDSTLRKLGQGRSELEVCLEVLVTFRQELLHEVDDLDVCRRVEDIMHAARFMTTSAIEWLEGNRWLITSEALQGALAAFDRLTQVSGNNTFWDRLEHELKALPIHTCFLTQYVGADLEQSRLFWAYSTREAVPSSLRGQTFPTSTLLPGRLANRPRDYALIVRPLAANGHPLGNAFLSYSAGDISTYEPLIAVISSALERSKRA